MTELHFKGKEFVYNHHLTVPHRPLVIDAAKGIGTPRLDGNLIIQGDNLHALKALLPTHAGRVDCIFIDPPYNTGNEGWCYSDNVNSPMIKEWLRENFDPDTGKRRGVTKEDGLRHDKWCAMMWPRLRLLWELLSEDGVLCVCIGNDECHRLQQLLDEIFRPDCFVGKLSWKSRAKPSNMGKAKTKPQNDAEYILAYSKDKDAAKFRLIVSGEARSYPHSDADGAFRIQTILKSDRGENKRETMRFEVQGYTPPVGQRWQGGETFIKSLFAKNRAEFRDGTPWFKYYEAEEADEVSPFYCHVAPEISGTAEGGKTVLNRILGDHHGMDTVKPLGIIDYILQRVTGTHSIVLDSFAGSGTTAHAVLEANRRDGGNRRFILVELEDYADRLTAERVRRVITGYPYKGTLKTELHRESLTWAKLQKAERLTETVEKIETLHGHEYDRITKRIDGGEFIVTGERTVDETAPGLGGEFTYCTLGDPIDMDRILSGDQLPGFKALGTVLFHTATNQTCDPALMDVDTGYLGAAGGAKLWLVYQPDLAWLKTPQAALTLSYAQRIVQADPTTRHIVFAPANHTSPSLLRHHKITTVEFAPLPYALYRVERG